MLMEETQGNKVIDLMNPLDWKLEKCVSGMLMAKFFFQQNFQQNSCLIVI